MQVNITNSVTGVLSSDPNPIFTVDFNGPVQQKNPLALFRVSGSSRVDVVYSKEAGLVYVVAFVTDPSAATKIQLTVPAGVATRSDGQPNAFATSSILYRPASAASGISGNSLGTIANWGMISTVAASFGAAFLSPAAMPIGVGAINFVGFAQTFAMSANLPIQNMPSNYRAVASSLANSFTGMNPANVVSSSSQTTAAAVARQKAQASLKFGGFPYPPVLITVGFNSSGSPPSNPIMANTTSGQPVAIAPVPGIQTISPPSPGANSGVLPDPFIPEGTPPQPTSSLVVPSPPLPPYPSPLHSFPQTGSNIQKTVLGDYNTPPTQLTQQQGNQSFIIAVPNSKRSPPPAPPAPGPVYVLPVRHHTHHRKRLPARAPVAAPARAPAPAPVGVPIVIHRMPQRPPMPMPTPPLSQQQAPQNDSHILPFVPTPALPPQANALPPDLDDYGWDLPGMEDGEGNGVINQESPPPVPTFSWFGKRRHLLLTDPITALTSSGFSYVVTTATANGSQVDLSNATVGNAILSRIRTIEAVAPGAGGGDGQRLEVLWNVLFWSAMVLAGTLALHLIILSLLWILQHRRQKGNSSMSFTSVSRPLPKMLHLPRLELLVFMLVLPMIAAAGSGLLQSSTAWVVALGVLFSMIIPFGFLITVSVFLVRFLLQGAIDHRRAVYILIVPVQDSAAEDADVETNTATRGNVRSRLSVCGRWMYAYLLRPLFGFTPSFQTGVLNTQQEDAHSTEDSAWLGKDKWDAQFVKRYGCFFEDNHGPPVVRVRSRYATSQHGQTGTDPDDGTVGLGVLVPSPLTGAEGALAGLRTFGIVFAVTKMVLFAVIINAPGGVDSLVQVIVLTLIAAMHVIYLRLVTPYRLRVELAAEIVASVCDLAVFACGIALIVKPQWTPEEERSMGTAMLVLQAIGFLVFISVRLALAGRTFWLTITPMLRKRRSADEAGS